jgi:hypothetical protein
MKKLWFKTINDKLYPYKIILNDKTIYYPEPMFEHLTIGENIEYYRIKEDKTVIKRILEINKLYKNDKDIWTIEGDFKNMGD